jgi:uncharacterized repeat protein (TIGR03803 family)
VRNRSGIQSPLARGALTVAAASVALVLGSFCNASAYTFSTLHSFCNAVNCTDGSYPKKLLLDSSGDLYGIATGGGKYTEGLVFKLIPNAHKTQYSEHILKNFCADTGCPGGGQPYGLISDVEGNLYGTTGAGGKYGNGTIFGMTHKTNGWSYKVLHNFCANSCTDGTLPTADLTYKGQISGKPWNGTSPLFGMTLEGGSTNRGVVYELTTDGSSWTYKVIRNFQTASTQQSLLMDAGGNLFGISAYSGKYDNGFLFKLAHDTWKETTLHNFCKTDGCADGAVPYGAIVIDGAGNLFGTAIYGGNSSCSFEGYQGCGVVYEYTAAGTYEVTYDFCSLANCADGWRPVGGLSLDGSNLIGTTWGGGVNNNDGGVAFRLKPNGTENVLYSFCSKNNCKDGTGLNEPMILDGHGDLFGTTEDGGANGDYGTVFELTK